VTDVPGYQLERLIGRGASGEVWLAKQRSAGGRTVAVKCIATGESATVRVSLQTEGQLLASLEHPNIVTLHDIVQRSGGVALIMQYAGGGSLASLLEKRRLSPGQVVAMAAPLADALDYAHSSGVIHGDVTPANVLFTEDARPLLADFGISRVAARLSARSGLVGTPHYLDPQVVLGAPPDAVSDIYALGAICFEALTGRPPYVGDTPFELLRKARTGERPTLAEIARDVPAALAAVVERALSVEPADRYPNAREMAAALREACDLEPLTVAPPDAEAGVPAAPARPTQEFGPRPPPRAPRSPAHAKRGAWDKAADLVGSRGARTGALVVLTALALTAVGFLVLGDDESPRATPAAQQSSLAPTTIAPVASTSLATATSAPTSSSAPAVSQGEQPTPKNAEEWAEVLAILDERRSEAYRAADVALLSAVYAPGDALRADTELVEGLATTKERVEDLQLVYKDVKVVESSDKRAVLAVTDELPAYQRVDADGKVLERYAGRGAKRWRITLVNTKSGWRISTIDPVA
jgi:hypothetical protein